MTHHCVLAGDDLRGAVTFASKLLTSRSCRIPVLAHLRITVNGDVRVEATDLENRLSIDVAKLGGDGTFEVLLPARALGQALQADTSDTVTLSPGEGVDALLGRTRLVGWDPAEFPSGNGPLSWKTIAEISACDLERALRQVSFARSTEVIRFALTGVLLETGRGGLGHFVASDGKRLAACPFARGRERKPFRAILSAVGAGLAAGLAKRAEGSVVIEAGYPEGGSDLAEIRFSARGLSVRTKPIDGHFPDWEAVIPSQIDKVFRLNPEELASAIRIVKVACSDKKRAVRFDLSPTQIRLLAKDLDKGEATATLSCSGEGEATIVFSPEYILDYLASLPRKTAEIEWVIGKPDQAGVFRLPGDGARYVLMPLQINV
jgi:DNA polymerase-3 subunit beta